MKKIIKTSLVICMLLAVFSLITACGKTYKVTFETNGGSIQGENVVECEYKTDYTLPLATKDGYVFDGWYTTDDFSDSSIDVLNISKAKKNKLTLYAKFVKLINIRYETSGGTTSNPTSVRVDATINLTAAENQGVVFDAWYFDPEFNNKVTQIVNPTSDLVLYAKYFQGYKVSYDLNGGVNNPSNPTLYASEKGATLFQPTRVGYDFVGWVDENGSDVVGIEIGTKRNLTLKAIWTPATYKITWNTNGGVLDEDMPETYVYGQGIENLNSLPIPKRSFDLFSGWYMLVNGTEVAVDKIDTDIYGDIELKANWIESREYKYTPNWNVSGSTDSSSYDSYDSNAYTIQVPKELQHLVARGILGVKVYVEFELSVRANGNATAKALAGLYLDGSRYEACSASSTGNGYLLMGTGPFWGDWGYDSGIISKSIKVSDVNGVRVGYYYSMSSNKVNILAETQLSYACKSIYYSFYIIEQ